MQSNEDQKASVLEKDIEQHSISRAQSMKEAIRSKGEALISHVLVEGAALYDEVVDIDKTKDGDPINPKIIKSHAIGHQSKQLVLLYRDTIFELQKAEILLNEGSATEDQLHKLLDLASETIQNAEAVYDESLAGESASSANANMLVKQDHPWPIYATQLAEIKNHLDALTTNESKLVDLSLKVKAVKEIISQRLNGIKNRFTDLEAQAENILRSKDLSDIDVIIDLLSETNQSLDQPGVLTAAHEQIESAIHETPISTSAIVNIKGGVLIEEDLSPQYQLEQWYDIELLPLFEDANQQIDTMTYNLRLSLINISNRLELFQNSTKAFVFEEHLQPLHKFMESVPGFRSSIDALHKDISNRIDANLSLHPLLSEDAPFLSLGFQSSINRFKKEQNLLLERIGYYWGALKSKYFSIKSTVREESQLGDVEKVIRYIRGASADRKNIQYNNFFNAKVSMVEAFWMGRELEQKRISQVIKSWNEGYQGAILFHGDRYAGKSSLGDWVSQQYFRGKTYELKPNRSIMISKSKVDLTDDLIQSIRSFIERVQYARPMIWIDDLELWFDDQHLSDEVTAELMKIINEYGKKVFFAVSIGTWMYERLNRVIDMEHVFQSTIELSPFSKEILTEAILLRHGASHKSLIGKDGQELSKIEFNKYVAQVASQSKGNIGHALQLWVNSIQYKDDQHVQMAEVMTYKFPDILTSDNGIILSSLLVHRKLSEKELHVLLGPAYTERYSNEVERLVGYGVIRRAYNGMLSINEKVVPAITEALRQNRFI